MGEGTSPLVQCASVFKGFGLSVLGLQGTAAHCRVPGLSVVIADRFFRVRPISIEQILYRLC